MTTSNDEAFMRLAIEEAKCAFENGEIPVGAVAVYRGEIVGRGHNGKETQCDPTAHAEIIALREAARTQGGWRLLDVTLYCTLEPCPMCAGAMIQARLPRLIYALDDPKAGAAGSVIDLLHHPQLNHQVQVTRGLLSAQVQDLIGAFFCALREGTIPRYSEAWKHRRLAEKHESV